MNLVFLDVDGVLNKAESKVGLEPNLVQLLMNLVEEYEASIVLSTTWKYNSASKEQLRLTFEKYAPLSPQTILLSQTPDLRGTIPNKEFGRGKENFHDTRTDEILVWLLANTCEGRKCSDTFPLPFEWPLDRLLAESHRFNGPHGEWILKTPIEVKGFVIFDDMNLPTHGCFGKMIENNFVRTMLTTGLTPDHILQAGAIISETKFADFARISFQHCTNPLCYLKPAVPVLKNSAQANKNPTNDRTLEKNFQDDTPLEIKNNKKTCVIF